MQNQTPENLLLRQLPQDEWDAIRVHLELQNMQIKDPMYESNKPFDFVYFPESGVESIVASVEQDEFVEVATIGREGFVGIPQLFGANSSPHFCFCQIPGPVLRLPSVDFKRFLTSLPVFSLLVTKYADYLFNQIAQSAACNRSHNVDARCARWLLFCHDRMDRRSFPLTQEFLGQMLGVRRPAVSVAASTLQKAGLISYVRGIVTVSDREGLEEASCKCYQVVCKNYEDILGYRTS